MIYLDYQATTPLAPEARAAMLPWLDERFGNPHSPHRMGREAKAAVEVARERVAALLDLPRPVGVERSRDTLEAGAGVSTSLDANGRARRGAGRLLFTSGATEVANWALKGALAAAPAGRRRLVTIATEHACVLDSAEWLATQGCEVVVLPVGGDGLVDLDAAARAIDGTTALVAAMLVNNEIGVIQPIAILSEMARQAGALMFCDAVQGYGRLPIPAACDMIAISAHKIHGPKGIGALWLRDGVALEPLLHGGGQEGGIRSGTLSPALCAGFGAAAALAAQRMGDDFVHARALYDRARDALGAEWQVNGSERQRYPGNLGIRRDGLDVGRLMSELRNVAFSAGSACASGSGRPSHVLNAIGLSDAQARSGIRLGFGRYTTVAEIDSAVAQIDEAAARQRVWA